jgi:hypothetical protein
VVGQTVDDFDRDRGAFGVGSGDDAQVGFGFDGDDLGNGAGVAHGVLPEAAFVSVACTVMDRIRAIEC